MAVVLSILAGMFAVVQAGINKMISQSWGFSSALLLNGIVFLVFNLMLFAIVWSQPRFFPGEYVIQGRLSDFRLWWIVPGLCGFMLVSSLVIAMSKIGALQTFVICIASQILCSMMWDYFVSGKELSTARLVGAAVTMAGAVITSMSSSSAS